MCEKGDLNPCAFASDLEADSLTTRTFSLGGGRVQCDRFFRYRELNPGLGDTFRMKALYANRYTISDGGATTSRL
jgi:hypothetical protein